MSVFSLCARRSFFNLLMGGTLLFGPGATQVAMAQETAAQLSSEAQPPGSGAISVADQRLTAAETVSASASATITVSSAVPVRAERQILNLMSQKVDLEYAKADIKNVVTDLQNRFGINVVLDITAKEDGLSEGETVSGKVHNLSLASALELLLREKNATWTIRNESLLIISLDFVDDVEFLQLVTYDVSFLFPQFSPNTTTPLTMKEVAPLFENIQALIEPDKWAEQGGNYQIQWINSVNRAVILGVAAPGPVHLRLQAFLQELRQVSMESSPAK